MKYLKLFKTKNEFNSDKRNSPEDYEGAYVSYILSDLRQGDVVKIADGHNSSVPPSVIWVDDFPDYTDLDDWAEDAGYASFSDYMDAYLVEPMDFGSNKFCLTDETMLLDGEEYYVYEFEEYDGNEGNTSAYYGLLPVNLSYEYLASVSMAADYDNRYTAFACVLNTDGNVMYGGSGTSIEDTFVVVMVEE